MFNFFYVIFLLFTFNFYILNNNSSNGHFTNKGEHTTLHKINKTVM